MSLEQVYGAITFYLANRAEIDAYLSECERLWEEARYDRKKALDVLGAFIQAKLDAKQRDEDLATAYWNAANYHEDDFREMNRPELRTQTVEALRKALEIAPSYLEELLRDKDFAGLRESDEGKALLKDFGAKNGS